MGTMTGVKRQSLSEAAVAALIDPRTGEHLRPLGVVGGRKVWPIMGGSETPPEDGGGSDKDKDPEGGGSKSDDPDGKDDPDKSSKDDKGNPDAKIADLEEEKDRHYKRRQEAEAELEETRKKLKKLEDKDTSDEDRIKNRVTELESENSQLTESLRERTLENAFLRDNTYTWHNPGRALKLADLSKVEIDEDGTVHGLKEALDKLAKSDAYLIKQEEPGDKDPPPNTDDPKNKSKKDKKGESEEDKRKKLHEKYPALRR